MFILGDKEIFFKVELPFKWGPSSSPQKGHSSPDFSAGVQPKRLPVSATAELLFYGPSFRTSGAGCYRPLNMLSNQLSRATGNFSNSESGDGVRESHSVDELEGKMM